MNDEGILRCKYILEDNEELRTKIIHMVKCDNTAQWLAGDELKRDQFKFIYKTMKVINDCALREQMLIEDKKVITTIIPNLTAYHAVLVIKGIVDKKEDEKKKELEKAERE